MVKSKLGKVAQMVCQKLLFLMQTTACLMVRGLHISRPVPLCYCCTP